MGEARRESTPALGTMAICVGQLPDEVTSVLGGANEHAEAHEAAIAKLSAPPVCWLTCSYFLAGIVYNRSSNVVTALHISRDTLNAPDRSPRYSPPAEQKCYRGPWKSG
jgi:hypothetical protein